MELKDTNLDSKYAVCKFDDVEKYLSSDEQQILVILFEKIVEGRGKPFGQYVCVNLEDEELARKVVDLVEEAYGLRR